VDIRRLRCFVVVAEERHFGRAAARLGMAQPPLTRQIQRLEAELGLELLRRSPRQVELTSAGELLFEQGRRLIESLQELENLMRAVTEGTAGIIRIGFTDPAGYQVVPAALARFRRVAPDVALDVRMMRSVDVTDGLLDGTLDVGFLHPAAADPRLELHDVGGLPLVVALPAGHPLLAHERVAPQLLQDERWVIVQHPTGTALAGTVEAVCRDAGFEPRVAHVTYTPEVALGLVAAGVGIAVVPLHATGRVAAGVEYRELSAPNARYPLLVAHRRDADSPLVDRFVRIVRDAGDERY
jgi:DNA-binding transcriptional LysR family regulator